MAALLLFLVLTTLAVKKFHVEPAPYKLKSAKAKDIPVCSPSAVHRRVDLACRQKADPQGSGFLMQSA